MSFLFPLYVLGALAVGLPLVFHLIQRRPRGEMPFSSLMFLSPSPPRMTRRSRLDNLLLLLLRALALLLLAIAFARPFLRSLADRTLDTPSRTIVLLVDTSASMQREGLWQEAREEAERVLDDIRPTDRVALATFDAGFHWLVGFEDSANIEPGRRSTNLRRALGGTTPGWSATNLGMALATAADMLQGADMLQTSKEEISGEGTLPPHIVLITDLQSGSDLSELDRFEWPEEVRVDIRQVTAEGATNASLVLLSEQAVRVFNTADASRSQFRLGWADTQGKLQGDREYPVHVPPGESRVVRIEPHASSDRLMLIGDDHSFDNTLYIARRTARSRTLLYLGAATDDRSNLLYYLRRAALDTSWQTVQAECQPPDSPVIPGSPLFELDPERTPLVVIGATLPETAASHLRTRYVEHGGHVLVVLTQPSVTDPAFARSLRVLLGLPSVTIEEVETADYVMLEAIDFRHPLFLPFADPKFSDFTKIRFWTHRRLAADEDPTWDVLASFDDGTPALVEQRVGKGTCRVLTSGWQPEESQLALSTKFVPLLAGMLDPMGGQPPVAASYFVGQPVAVPNSDEPGRVVSPDGQEHALVDATVFTNTDVPGIYAWEEGERSEPFAVNIVSRESRTEPLDPGQLEQRGVRTGKSRTMDAIQQQRRQLRDMELESRQKWWRWLIAGAIGVLLVETWLGGWLSRRRNAD